MHVAVDAHNLLSDRRGIGVYVRQILRIWVAQHACELTLVIRHPIPWLVKKKIFSSIRQGDMRIRVARKVPKGADVCWHPWNGTFVFGAKRNVATVHDVTPFALPDPDPKKRVHQKEPFLTTARTADAIVTDSEFSKEEIVRYLEYPKERITVVPLAASGVFSPAQAQEQGRPYVLFVGNDEPRKNFATLASAQKTAFAQGEVVLVKVAGGKSDEELRDLYRGALCVAVPSIYEGFGLPALEAMACGAPVIASRAASLPEVCGEAALYVEAPLDVNEWSAALRNLYGDGELRAKLARSGLDRARQFSWERTAAETLAILQQAV